MTVKLSRTVLVAGVVTVVLAVLAAVVVLATAGDALSANAKQIIILQMLGMVPTLIAAVAGLAARTKLDEVHHDLQNGLIPAKVEEGINNMAADPAIQNVVITHSEDNSDANSD